MPISPLFGLGVQAKSPVITAQRRLNCFYEFTPDGDKQRVVIIGTPGTTLFSDLLGTSPNRGWIKVGNVFYVVNEETLWEFNNAGSLTNRGTLSTTSGKVGITYDGTRLLIVDGTAGYTYQVASTTFAVVVSNFPNGANTCDWLDGQFIVDAGDDSDLFYISADGTTWDALDFAAAESQPDGIVRVFVDHGEVLLFGGATIEPWGNVGATDFPFAPIKGSIAEIGLAARWSLCKFNDGLAFLGKNLQGQSQVYYMKGYTPIKISTQELDALIESYGPVPGSSAFSFMDRGHPMYQINFNAVGKSWRFDGSTNLWFEVAYGLDEERYRGEMALDYLNQTLLADYENGSIYRLDETVFTDVDEPIVRELRGRHIFNQEDQLVVNELYVDFATGVGLQNGQGDDPQIMLQISKDNGRTFGNELWTSLGRIGAYLTRVHWRRLGISFDWLFKLKMTDPVPFIVTYAAIKTRKGGQ